MLIEQLQADLLNARKTREPIATSLLTALVGEAAMVGKNAGNRASTDDETMAMVRKFLKNAEETSGRLATAGKDTAVVNEEIAILKAYIPQQLSDDELRAAISDILADSAGANMGAIMKILKEAHGGLYDGRRANELIKEMLS
jgi:hypothetical protein